MHVSFLFHHSNLQLAYTTQAWILKFKTCAMQANIWNAPYKFMSLLPYLFAQNFNWSPSFVISLPLCQIPPYHLYLYFFPPLLSFYYLSTLFLPLTLISLFFSSLSSMAIKVQNVDRLRLSMPINGVRIIFPNFIQSRSFAKDI